MEHIEERRVSVEEKAKAYDGLIERLKDLKFAYRFSPLSDTIEEKFPELRESKDDRIRKALINGFNKLDKNAVWYNGITNGQILAWLEKQAEQNPTDKVEPKDYNSIDPHFGKPIDKVEPKFNVGDEIKTSNEELLTITKIDEKGYWSDDLFICGFDDAAKWELVGQKPAEWSEDDERMLGKCIDAASGYYSPEDKQNMKDWLRTIKDRVQPQPKQEWSESDKDRIEELVVLIRHSNYTDGVKRKVISWLDSLKDRVYLQLLPQQEWSEEDEQTFIKSVEALEDFGKFELADWFKEHKPQFLRHQTTWKPSDEQMKALREAVIEMGKSVSRCSIEEFHEIESLYNDLKKLKV